MICFWFVDDHYYKVKKYIAQATASEPVGFLRRATLLGSGSLSLSHLLWFCFGSASSIFGSSGLVIFISMTHNISGAISAISWSPSCGMPTAQHSPAGRDGAKYSGVRGVSTARARTRIDPRRPHTCQGCFLAAIRILGNRFEAVTTVFYNTTLSTVLVLA